MEERATSLIKDFILSLSTPHGSCLTNPITLFIHPLSEYWASARSPPITPFCLLGFSQNTSDSPPPPRSSLLHTDREMTWRNTTGLMSCWGLGKVCERQVNASQMVAALVPVVEFKIPILFIWDNTDTKHGGSFQFARCLGAQLTDGDVLK